VAKKRVALVVDTSNWAYCWVLTHQAELVRRLSEPAVAMVVAAWFAYCRYCDGPAAGGLAWAVRNCEGVL
jgi:hypothetical protein